ncbi:MAG: class I SAM-dependent methyltransferase [Chitinophagaceae bacterium]
MSYENVQYQFNAVSEKYDVQRKILIPCFNDFYAVPLELSEQLTDIKTILDVGAGTGLMSAFFHGKYPDAQLTLVDISEKMLNKAKDRFEGEDNVHYLQADFADVDFGENQYDAVISGLAIHHLPDDLKRVLFAKVYRALKLDGIFINADQVEGETAAIDRFYKGNWVRKVKDCSLTEEEKQSAFERVKIDIFAKLSDQLQWLRDAGFEDVGNYYQYYNFVVFSGRKHDA